MRRIIGFLLFILLCGPQFALANHPDNCKNISRDHLAPPKIFVYKIRRSSINPHDVFRVTGTIEGSCLSQAGYFEKGYEEKKFPLKTTRDFERFEFGVDANARDFPEIRVYNTAGDSDIYQLKFYDRALSTYEQEQRPETSHGSYAEKGKDYYATGPVSPKDRKKIRVYSTGPYD